jgi:hypothetical protein
MYLYLVLVFLLVAVLISCWHTIWFRLVAYTIGATNK